MDNDEAYDMGYTDGHQDGERDAWLIATPIIQKLRAAVEKIHQRSTEVYIIELARAALEEK